MACRFPDCTHTHETGCHIKSAVDEGKISPLRYESYVRMFLSEAIDICGGLEAESWRAVSSSGRAAGERHLAHPNAHRLFGSRARALYPPETLPCGTVRAMAGLAFRSQDLRGVLSGKTPHCQVGGVCGGGLGWPNFSGSLASRVGSAAGRSVCV